MTWFQSQLVARTAITIAIGVLERLVVQADSKPPIQPLLEPALALPFIAATWAFGWQIGRRPRQLWSAPARAKARRRVEDEELADITLGIAQGERN